MLYTIWSSMGTPSTHPLVVSYNMPKVDVSRVLWLVDIRDIMIRSSMSKRRSSGLFGRPGLARTITKTAVG